MPHILAWKNSKTWPVPSGPITGPEGAKTPVNRFLRSNGWTGGNTHR